jgi:hypothetical protein
MKAIDEKSEAADHDEQNKTLVNSLLKKIAFDEGLTIAISPTGYVLVMR